MKKLSLKLGLPVATILIIGFIFIPNAWSKSFLRTNFFDARYKITSLQPKSGPIGAIVTIRGKGFTATGNKVKFGNLGSEDNPAYNLTSPDGRTIAFTVPAGNYLSCWFTVPTCSAPAIRTQPGNYGVSVINANGTSNEVPFTVTESQ